MDPPMTVTVPRQLMNGRTPSDAYKLGDRAAIVGAAADTDCAADARSERVRPPNMSRLAIRPSSRRLKPVRRFGDQLSHSFDMRPSRIRRPEPLARSM